MQKEFSRVKKRYPEAKGITDAHHFVEQGHKKGNVVISVGKAKKRNGEKHGKEWK